MSNMVRKGKGAVELNFCPTVRYHAEVHDMASPSLGSGGGYLQCCGRRGERASTDPQSVQSWPSLVCCQYACHPGVREVARRTVRELYRSVTLEAASQSSAGDARSRSTSIECGFCSGGWGTPGRSTRDVTCQRHIGDGAGGSADQSTNNSSSSNSNRSAILGQRMKIDRDTRWRNGKEKASDWATKNSEV